MEDRYSKFYKSYEWRKVRYDALRAADGKCQLCGRSKHDGIVLNVDHIVPIKKDWSQRCSLANLQVLCHECNHGKGNRDNTDWRRSVPRVRPTKAEKRKKRRKKKDKAARIQAKARKQERLDRYKFGKMGAASEVRVVSIEEWIADKIREGSMPERTER